MVIITPLSAIHAELITHDNIQMMIGRDLISSQVAPNFVMRWFQLLPTGHTSYHHHSEEHQLYLLKGKLRLKVAHIADLTLQEGNFCFVAAEEPHAFYNLEDQPAEFLFVSPKVSNPTPSNLVNPRLLHINYDQVSATPVTDFGSTRTTIRVFIDKKLGSAFIMRRFEIQPGGHIGIHAHAWEHEMFFLSGTTQLLDDTGQIGSAQENTFVYMPPDHPHGYKNVGVTPVSFICIIPNI